MKNISVFLLALLAADCAVASSTPTSPEPQSELFDLSFEELMDVNISLASKTDETAASVPSSITVFNYSQIASLGVDNVYELMNFVPGFQSTRGDWVGAVPKEHTRGVYLDTGHVLVMVDGHRLNESSFGKASVYTPFIPIEIVEKVEFIRGPGSALYGSNAFLGVMNVVTKSKANEFFIGVGENGTAQVATNLHHQVNQDTQLRLNAAVNRRSGEKYFTGAVKDPLEALYFNLAGSHQQWNWNLRYNETSLDEFLNLSRYSNNNQHKSYNYAAMLEHLWQVSDRLKMTNRLSFIEHNIESAGLIATGTEVGAESGRDFLVGPDWQSKDLTYNLDGSYRMSDSLDWNFGAEYSKEEQSEAGIRTSYFDPFVQDVVVVENNYLGGVTSINPFVPFKPLLQRFDSYAGYLQLKYKHSEQLTVFTGARFDEVKNIDSKFSPRVAVIYSLNDNHTFKYQYGESFRTPVSNELNSNDDVTIGNSQLKSENVKTTELVWHYQGEKLQFSTVLFENQLQDFINLVPINDPIAEFSFDNVFETDMQGMEISSDINLSESSWVQLAYTQLFDMPLNGSFKKFAALAYHFKLQGLHVTLSGIWRDKTFIPVPPGSGVAAFTQNSYLLAGGSIKWSINSQQSLTLKAENVFNKRYDVFDPRLQDGRVPQQGRNLMVQYSYQF
ncbi:TonB-dependent receptor plug domain-containing protein (plasmid) [Pseudoalteromonas sp. T1lg65]|uniref:TonB-dependent receptor plug domain-containing protein n=1 Tax=Pseudoalteromonas sp. T1lg65 TaxID=2077101 RepID=UPI003F7A61CA